MDNKDQKDISSWDFNKDNFPNDYKLLVQKLKSIKEIISILEKKFLGKRI